MNAILLPFIDAFIEEINEAFEQFQFWVNFSIPDPRKLPKAKEELKMYGNKELSELLSHYAVSKTDIFKANRTSAAANIDFDKAKSEWSGFKDFMFQKCEDYYHFIDSKIAAVQSLGTRVKPLQQFSKRMQYVLSKVILGVISTDDPMGRLHPKLLFFVTHVKYIPNKCSLC